MVKNQVWILLQGRRALLSASLLFRVYNADFNFWIFAGDAGAVNWKYGSYNTKEKTCAVVGWSGTQPSSGKLTIPSQATKDGVAYTVTAVSANALNGFTDVTPITIPASITKVAGNDGTGNSRVDIENFDNYSPMEHYETANARYYVPGKVHKKRCHCSLLMW